MKALVNILLMLFVSLLLTLSVLGGAVGFYAAGSKDQTESYSAKRTSSG